jgi:hypothetical protein
MHALGTGCEDHAVVLDQPRRRVQRRVHIVRQLVGVEERAHAALDDDGAARELEVDPPVHLRDRVGPDLELVILGERPPGIDLCGFIRRWIDERLYRRVAEDPPRLAGPRPCPKRVDAGAVALGADRRWRRAVIDMNR